jgi:hypothetical protein
MTGDEIGKPNVGLARLPVDEVVLDPDEIAVDRQAVAPELIDQRRHAVCAHIGPAIRSDDASGKQVDGIVESISATVAESPFANNGSRQFRQVMISVTLDQQQLPIGLRVSVQFSLCVSGRSSTGK